MSLQSAIASYFAAVEEGRYTDLIQAGVNLLPAEQVDALTQEFLFHPLVRALDGLVLDDPDTSNYHVLLRRPPFEGHVLYLSHDGDSRIVFPDLAALLDAADAAVAGDQSLSELHPPVSPHAMEQVAVSALLRELLDGGDEGLDVALALIPSLDLRDIALLEVLAVHEDLYVVEALAEQIAIRPSPELREIARRCAQHPHAPARRRCVLYVLLAGEFHAVPRRVAGGSVRDVACWWRRHRVTGDAGDATLRSGMFPCFNATPLT